jgi:hypothetical protein
VPLDTGAPRARFPKLCGHFMKKDSGKYCGNCFSHSAYEYPKKVFCERRFRSGASMADSVKDTLDTCEDWRGMSRSGRCSCVEDLQILLKDLLPRVVEPAEK